MHADFVTARILLALISIHISRGVFETGSRSSFGPFKHGLASSCLIPWPWKATMVLMPISKVPNIPKQMSQQLLASQKDKKHHYNILNYPH